MTDTMMAWAIRDKATGLYSTGGRTPTFKKVGKVWHRLGDVNSHLTMIRDSVVYRLKPGADRHAARWTDAYEPYHAYDGVDIEVIGVTFAAVDTQILEVKDYYAKSN